MDYSNFFPELRFYQNALLEMDKHITLEKTKRRIKQLGLFENKMKVFDSTFLYDQVAYDNSFDTTLITDKTAKSNLYAIPFGFLIGLTIGIFLSFLNFFYRNKAHS